ncbi:MAG TPA: hypothetical protein VGL08_11465 [Paraburkholderia sp.]
MIKKATVTSGRVGGSCLFPVALALLTLSGCAGSGASTQAGTTPDAHREYRPARVETTGSLIGRSVVAHVDDDDDDGVAGMKTGATSVSEMLNGNSAVGGTRMGQIR